MLAKNPPPNHSEWNAARPERLPGPTLAPVATALGITFFFWGFIASRLIAWAGILLFALSIGKWIGEIRNERR